MELNDHIVNLICGGICERDICEGDDSDDEELLQWCRCQWDCHSCLNDVVAYIYERKVMENKSVYAVLRYNYGDYNSKIDSPGTVIGMYSSFEEAENFVLNRAMTFIPTVTNTNGSRTTYSYGMNSNPMSKVEFPQYVIQKYALGDSLDD